MHILVAPVSGGAFPVQLGFMLETTRLRRKHFDKSTSQELPPLLPFYDVMMASSGGNVAIYMGLAGDFTQDGIEKMANRLHPSQFLSSWWPKPFSSVIPSWTLGYYKGSIFNRGSGVEKLFQDVFTPSSISQVEIWTGTLNRTTSRAEIFTNLSQGQSKLDTKSFLPDRINSMPLNYMNHDPRLIARVSYASAAIPVLVPSVRINGSLYADGGTCFSSPLTPLQDCIKGAVEGNSQPLHIDYLSSYDLESPSKLSSYCNLFQNGSITLEEIIKSLGVQDRLSGIELMRRGRLRNENGVCNREKLEEIYRRRQTIQDSFLELYPSKEIEIPLDAFTSKDIMESMNKARNSIMYRFWYVE